MGYELLRMQIRIIRVSVRYFVCITIKKRAGSSPPAHVYSKAKKVCFVKEKESLSVTLYTVLATVPAGG